MKTHSTCDSTFSFTGWMQWTYDFPATLKITVFSFPRFDSWRKDLDLFSPMAANLILCSRYYVQTNSKSTLPFYFPAITIKSELLSIYFLFFLYDGSGFKHIKGGGLRMASPSWPLSFELNVNIGVKQSVTSNSVLNINVSLADREGTSSPCL